MVTCGKSVVLLFGHSFRAERQRQLVHSDERWSCAVSSPTIAAAEQSKHSYGVTEPMMREIKKSDEGLSCVIGEKERRQFFYRDIGPRN